MYIHIKTVQRFTLQKPDVYRHGILAENHKDVMSGCDRCHSEHLMSAEQQIEYNEYKAGTIRSISGGVIVERPVSLFVNGQLWLTFI